jgi:hypothetical protein
MVLAVMAVGLSSAVARPPAAASAPVPVTLTVTALGPGYLPAAIPQDHLTVFSGKTPLSVAQWARAIGPNGSLQLAILIDNNIKENLAGGPMQDLADFVRSQPGGVSIGVFFAEKGKAKEASNFSMDHEAIAASLLSEKSAAGESLRVYPSLPDLAAHWPTPFATRREILMIGSGYDALIGGIEDPNINAGNNVYTGTNYDHNVSGERDPYLHSMMESVQRAGIVVHSIYVADPRFAQMVDANIMRDKLIEFSTATGGLAFYNGNSADAFTGYLRQLSNALESQYLLTISTGASHKSKGEFRDISVTTNEPGVVLFVPQQTFIPGA